MMLIPGQNKCSLSARGKPHIPKWRHSCTHTCTYKEGTSRQPCKQRGKRIEIIISETRIPVYNHYLCPLFSTPAHKEASCHPPHLFFEESDEFCLQGKLLEGFVGRLQAVGMLQMKVPKTNTFTEQDKFHHKLQIWSLSTNHIFVTKNLKRFLSPSDLYNGNVMKWA